MRATLHEILDEEAKRDGWGEPEPGVLDPSSEPPPPLPLETFGPFWGDWIWAAAEAKGAPPDYVVGALLDGAGALLANVRRARPWPGWVEPPILYVGAIGNPSADKSPALDAVSGLLDALEAAEGEGHGARKRQHAAEAEAASLRLKAWQGEVKEAVKLGYAPPPQPAAADAGAPPERPRIVV
ncbi:MAG: DUF3987 domain-containing protein [Geminicoccaceae bacterium]|nr:DUF3987 domain-containing protein [Geminicoccaceae bacterium]